MSRSELGLFNDSLARCRDHGRFFDQFLELFLASSDEVRAKFHSTDLVRQRRMLQSSFYMLVEYLALGSPESEKYLERIAAEHGRQGRDIPPHLYDFWLEALLRAVQKCDDRYSTEVEAAWRHVMGAGIHFLTSRYDGPER
jgi:hypothetical protein